MDAKDYAILRELDINFRQSFSSIGKKVKLSKNSVALRFEKLKDLMLHNVTGINNELIGQTMVKVYYSFDFYDEKTEKNIIEYIKNNSNIMWAARMYGPYDLCIAIFIDDLHPLISEINRFNKKFSSKINQKEMQIVYKQIFFRNNFIHNQPVLQSYKLVKIDNKVILNDSERKILKTIKYNPRMSIIEIAQKTNLTQKTASNYLKKLQKLGVITGYFMTLNPIKFNLNTFKLMIQIQNLKDHKEFEAYLQSIKNVRYVAKMLGLWDYEIDLVYQNINDLQAQIEMIKQRFPNVLKKISILSMGNRLVTNDNFFGL